MTELKVKVKGINEKSSALCLFQRNLPNVWQNAEHFFDLSDFLTWKATKGLSENRSLCSLVCKWTYDGVPEAGWSESYFKEIGLEDVDLKKIGLPDQVSTNLT